MKKRTTQSQVFSMSGKIYSVTYILKYVKDVVTTCEKINTTKKVNYYNVSCAFDIETSSFYNVSRETPEKCAVMYEWTLGINGVAVIGRTWDKFLLLLKKICEILGLDANNRLVIYVHNLGYEFQFIRKYFEWLNVFAVDTRKPVYAVTTTGIEFRCSYILSGYSLEKVGEHLQAYPVKKLVGSLDYSKIRTYKTIITQAEKNYCVNDVLVVMSYIQEEIEKNGDITKIPMTKTGYVRRFCRNKLTKDYNNPKKSKYKALGYHDFIKRLSITPDEYKQLKRAFQGGFTHANALRVGIVLNNVASYDITSSYPTVMLSEKFPMSKAEIIYNLTPELFKTSIEKYCCLFDVEITGLDSKYYYENYISRSRCFKCDNAVVNNGRIVKADLIRTTITEQDYCIIKRFYRWSNMRVANFRRYKRGYLPKNFILAILELYKKKTELKGVGGKEVEYLSSKEMINSCYGMCVTDPIQNTCIYTNDWETITPDIETELQKYNDSWSRFLYYPWGVWVTAYARVNLFTAIINAGDDYIYSDTDSVKLLNQEKHINYFDKYNNMITFKIEKCLNYYNIPLDSYKPKTIKGVEKPLGVWDFEGVYTRFKTLGAKRYVVDKEGDINITVSGLNKKITVPYMVDKYGDDVFNFFDNNLYIPKGKTGKNIHTYIDDTIEGVVTDYQGKHAHFKELSCIHLEESDYSLSLADNFIAYLLEIKGKNEI